jgi:hypothetical protein
MASAAILPRHSSAAGDYTLVFTGQDAAVQGTDFITFALVDTTHGDLSLVPSPAQR